MRMAYCRIENKKKILGLNINKDKTKYMKLPAVEAYYRI